jgi:hypothetical protein
MATLNVYEQYFAADCVANSINRHGALVMLTVTSEEGNVRYEAAVTFFPHIDETDYAVSYDAYYADVLYDAPGRRSKKREAQLLETLREDIDVLAARANAVIYWDQPLREARFG